MDDKAHLPCLASCCYSESDWLAGALLCSTLWDAAGEQVYKHLCFSLLTVVYQEINLWHTMSCCKFTAIICTILQQRQHTAVLYLSDIVLVLLSCRQSAAWIIFWWFMIQHIGLEHHLFVIHLKHFHCFCCQFFSLSTNLMLAHCLWWSMFAAWNLACTLLS